MAGTPLIRIALFTETFLPKIDGIVTRLRHTVAELQRQGDQVMVFAPGPGITDHHGATVERVAGRRFPLYPELTLALPSPRFRRQLMAFRPDVVHAADPAFLGLGVMRTSSGGHSSFRITRVSRSTCITTA